jgi:hypothetical protein
MRTWNERLSTKADGALVSRSPLLILAIVGTTIAPWQLFFQQSYVIDKRIAPRFINYEKTDLWIGIVMVIIGAVAMMACAAAAFDGNPEFGAFNVSPRLSCEVGSAINSRSTASVSLAVDAEAKCTTEPEVKCTTEPALCCDFKSGAKVYRSC